MTVAGLVLFVLGCGTQYQGDDDSAAGDDDSAEGDPDEDGDGYPASEDCDDGDAALNYDDADGDGVTSCDGDCDDSDAMTKPGMPERCDGLDNDCSGFAELDGDGVCGIWAYNAIQEAWTAYALNPAGSEHGPVESIEAAFAITDLDQVFVLTETQYHVLDPLQLTWIGSGLRGDLFPEVAGQSILAAAAISAAHQGGDLASIALMTETLIHSYTYTVTGGYYAYAGSGEYTGVWEGAFAPPPDTILAAWLDETNEFGWAVEGNPADLCGAESVTIGTYFAFMSNEGRIYLYDGQYCNDFISFVITDQWVMFADPDAPLASISRAVAWPGGRLLVFGPLP